MRWSATAIALLFAATTALSGCTDNAAVDGYVPGEAHMESEDVQRLLIRGFLDPMGFGRDDDVFRVRFGAVSYDQEGIPFDGTVKVFLEPQDPDTQDWIPRFWYGEVEQDRFKDDTGLPYWEFTADGSYLQPGEPVHLTIEAILPDGRTMTAERYTYA